MRDTRTYTICYKRDNYAEAQTLVKHKTFLAEIIDSDSGLLSKLLSKQTLTPGEIISIKEKQTYQERNAEFLECITDQAKHYSFVDALRNTRQTHVVNYLACDGKFNKELGGDWPLTDIQLQRLNSNQPYLFELLEMRDLVERLFSKDVISQSQRWLIDSRHGSIEKIEAFLQILRRMNQARFGQTIRCLFEMRQSHIAQILEEDGVLFRIHISTDAAIDEAYRFALQLSLELDDRSAEHACEKCNLLPLSNLRQLKAIAAKTSCNIVLYVYCKMLEEFERLKVSFKSGRLRESMEHLLGSMWKNSTNKPKVLNITIEDEDAELRFSELKQRYCNSNSLDASGNQPQSTEPNDLPLEQLDIILQLCYILSVEKSQFENLRDKDIIEKLISVNFLWLERMTRSWFKRTIFSRLAAHFQNRTLPYTAVQNNRQFLIEFIRPNDELIAKLESAKYLTKEQVNTIQRLRRDRDKTFEILRLLEPFDSQRIDTIIQCLHQTNQKQVESVMGSGGAAMKAIVKTNAAVKQMIQNLNALQSNECFKTVKIFDDDITGKTNHPNRRLKSVWILFRDPNDFRRMKVLIEGKYLNCSSCREFYKNVILLSVNMDRKQFDRKFVLFMLDVKCNAKLDTSDGPHIVTKLKEKIYVLCNPLGSSLNCAIYVFEDRNQFRLLEKIEIEGLGSNEDFVSSEKENCLYVTDNGKNCIWKIKEVEGENVEQKHEVVKWLAFTRHSLCRCTVTSHGEVLMITRQQNTLVMKIYGPNAKLRRTIQLPDEIRVPVRALKTSNASFIIVHEIQECEKSFFLQSKPLADENLIITEEGEQYEETDETTEDEEDEEDEELREEQEENETLHRQKDEEKLGEREKEKECKETERDKEDLEEGEDGHRQDFKNQKNSKLIIMSDLRINGRMSSCVAHYFLSRYFQYYTFDAGDRRFVAGRPKNEVTLLDSDFRLVESFLPPEKEKVGEYVTPFKMFCDSTNRQLFVIKQKGDVNVCVYTLFMRIVRQSSTDCASMH